MFICRDIGGGTLQWELVNDDSASSVADHSYTDSQITIETTARQNADSAEASARQAADTTLQKISTPKLLLAPLQIVLKPLARAAADAAEAVARATGDAASLATANAYTDAETIRATVAEATKANLAGGNNYRRSGHHRRQVRRFRRHRHPVGCRPPTPRRPLQDSRALASPGRCCSKPTEPPDSSSSSATRISMAG